MVAGRYCKYMCFCCLVVLIDMFHFHVICCLSFTEVQVRKQQEFQMLYIVFNSWLVSQRLYNF